MPKTSRTEFYFNPKTKEYRKRLTLPSGKQKDLYHRDPEQLRKIVAEWQEAIKSGRESVDNPTLAEYSVRWCEMVFPGLSEARIGDYRNIINNHILPGLGGNTYLKNITTADIDRLVASKANYSSSFHEKLITTLRRMFADAYTDGILSLPLFIRAKAKGKPTPEKEPLTASQQRDLIRAVEGTAAWPFVMLGLYAGLRKEEILGLKWDCVHFSGKAPYLRVMRVVVHEHNVARVTTKKKSRAANRKIPLPPPLLHCLQSWRIMNPYDFVVPNSTGGPRSAQSFRRLWEIVENRTAGAMKRWDKTSGRMVTVHRELGEQAQRHHVKCTLDFRCTPHLLRHTYITNLCAAHLDIKKIQYLAGHASVQTTLNIYAHVVGNSPEDLFDDISAAFSDEKSTP